MIVLVKVDPIVPTETCFVFFWMVNAPGSDSDPLQLDSESPLRPEPVVTELN